MLNYIFGIIIISVNLIRVKDALIAAYYMHIEHNYTKADEYLW